MNGPPFFHASFFWIEFVYSIFVVLAVLLVYLKTREMYKLTEHKGIKYFSLTFLFFAIAHIFRFFFRIFFRTFFTSPGFFMPGRPPFRIGSLIFTYTSVMAGLFLLYSLIWRKIKLNEKIVILIFNLIAVLTVILDLLVLNPFIHIIIITLLFLVAALLSFTRKSRKKHPFVIAYLLIFLIWILNSVFIEVPRSIFELRFVSYMISVILYLVILWRIFKSKNGKKTR